MNLKIFSFLFICEILLSSSVVLGSNSGGDTLTCGKPQAQQLQTLSGSQVTRGAYPW